MYELCEIIPYILPWTIRNITYLSVTEIFCKTELETGNQQNYVELQLIKIKFYGNTQESNRFVGENWQAVQSEILFEQSTMGSNLYTKINSIANHLVCWAPVKYRATVL